MGLGHAVVSGTAPFGLCVATPRPLGPRGPAQRRLPCSAHGHEPHPLQVAVVPGHEMSSQGASGPLYATPRQGATEGPTRADCFHCSPHSRAPECGSSAVPQVGQTTPVASAGERVRAVREVVHQTKKNKAGVRGTLVRMGLNGAPTGNAVSSESIGFGWPSTATVNHEQP